MGFMTHPASAGKESKTAFRQWKSMSHTERRSFREERERHGKKDQDRQDAKHTAYTKESLLQKHGTALHTKFVWILHFSVGFF